MNDLVVKTKIGTALNHIPYSCVPGIGTTYKKHKDCIGGFKSYNVADRRQYVFERIHKIVKYAIENIPFYSSFYEQKGFKVEALKCFEDIDKIPIVTKKDLMLVPLSMRSVKNKMSYVANTGGSTGVPLSFYKTRSQQIKEMAYYHNAWSKLGFSKSNLRLQFVGRSENEHIGYDFMRNRISASIYMPFEKLIEELSLVCKNNIISYIQGYPSVIYEFATFLKDNPIQYDRCGLKGRIRGVFLNSEFPYLNYRRIIEETFECKSVASYGQTEACVLAFDYGSGDYDVAQSYGYAEIKEIGGENHLIGTSYDNYSSPFIRYDIGDTVDNATINNGILNSFKMTNGGRIGQYIYDNAGKRISLTGLIFGKHHELFNYCSQMQISQSEQGKATVFYVAPEGNLHGIQPSDLFDANDINISFDFVRIDNPIRTQNGKVLLLVKQ